MNKEDFTHLIFGMEAKEYKRMIESMEEDKKKAPVVDTVALPVLEPRLVMEKPHHGDSLRFRTKNGLN